MNYQVTVTDVAACPTAVVAAATTWQEFPALWKEPRSRYVWRDYRIPAGLLGFLVLPR
jgi:hypothetical protein